MFSNDSIRRVKDKLAFVFGLACVFIAVVPLASILVEVVRNGLPALTIEFLTSPPGAIGVAGGGIANAIQGTLIIVGVTCLIGVPIGVMAGVYLAEFGDNQFGRTLRFLNDVLTEFPSIVVGIVAYSLIVLTFRSFSAIAGAVALSFIMVPIVTRSTEESLKIVPTSIRDAAIALGIRRWRTTLSVTLSTARSGVVTGVLLSVARIAGETAPLILTILGSQLFFTGLDRPMDALPLRIYRLALLPYPYAREQGWGAALVLIVMILGLNVIVRLLTKGRVSMRRNRL